MAFAENVQHFGDEYFTIPVLTIYKKHPILQKSAKNFRAIISPILSWFCPAIAACSEGIKKIEAKSSSCDGKIDLKGD